MVFTVVCLPEIFLQANKEMLARKFAVLFAMLIISGRVLLSSYLVQDCYDATFLKTFLSAILDGKWKVVEISPGFLVASQPGSRCLPSLHNHGSVVSLHNTEISKKKGFCLYLSWSLKLQRPCEGIIFLPLRPMMLSFFKALTYWPHSGTLPTPFCGDFWILHLFLWKLNGGNIYNKLLQQLLKKDWDR